MDTFAFFDGVFFDVDMVVAEITVVIMVVTVMILNFFPPFLFVLACRRQKCNDWCLGLVCKRN